MSTSRVCKILDEIPRDDTYRTLKSELFNEFVSGTDGVPGPAYKNVLRGVLDVLASCEDLDSDVILNSSCLVLIEDVASTGKCRFPWKIVKMLILLIYNNIFDEVYQENKSLISDESNNSSPELSKLNSSDPDGLNDFLDTSIPQIETEEEFNQLKLESVIYILDFNLPPFTLQRLCEIPLNQPYRACKKLFNAYRKLFTVRDIEYEPVQLPDLLDFSEFDKLEKVYSNLENWEKKYLGPVRPEWNEDLLCENSEEIESSDERPPKRPLE